MAGIKDTGAKQQWALENKKPSSAIPTKQELLPYVRNEEYFHCPGGGAYTIKAVSNAPTCSIGGHVLPE